MRQLKIDYNNLSNQLNSINSKNPQRIYSDIDLLNANIRDNILNTLSGGQNDIIININDNQETASFENFNSNGKLYHIEGDEIDNSKIIFSQVKKAERQAKKLGIYDSVFQEISNQ